MLKIFSKDNEKIKHLKNLAKKKYRDDSDQFLVENATIIYDALIAGKTIIEWGKGPAVQIMEQLWETLKKELFYKTSN